VNQRRKLRSTALTAAALGAVATVTVTLAQQPAAGAFTATTGVNGGTVSSASSFCTATPTTLYSTGDSWVDEAAPAANHLSDLDLRVRSSSAGDRRVWIGFALPGLPAPSTHCQLERATLSFSNNIPVAGRNIDVYRGDPTGPPWTAATVTWDNDPDFVGSPATNAATTSTPGRQEWDVTAHVVAQYADGNNGFLLKDRVENSATTTPAREQVYYDRQDTTYHPTLVLTWG
jgi:large repetitive protein